MKAHRYPNLRAWMRAMADVGVTQEHAARLLGISPAYLSQLLNGRRIGYRKRHHIARIAQIPVESLLEDLADR